MRFDTEPLSFSKERITYRRGTEYHEILLKAERYKSLCNELNELLSVHLIVAYDMNDRVYQAIVRFEYDSDDKILLKINPEKYVRPEPSIKIKDKAKLSGYLAEIADDLAYYTNKIKVISSNETTEISEEEKTEQFIDLFYHIEEYFLVISFNRRLEI